MAGARRPRTSCLSRSLIIVSERVDVTPAKFRVIVTRRLKYGCSQCKEGVSQAEQLLRAHAMRPRHCRHVCARRQRLSQNPPFRLRRPAPRSKGGLSSSRFATASMTAYVSSLDLGADLNQASRAELLRECRPCTAQRNTGSDWRLRCEHRSVRLIRCAKHIASH